MRHCKKAIFFFEQYYGEIENNPDNYYFFNKSGNSSDESDKENNRIWESIGSNAYYIVLLESSAFNLPNKTPISSVRSANFMDAVTLLSRKKVMS